MQAMNVNNIMNREGKIANYTQAALKISEYFLYSVKPTATYYNVKNGDPTKTRFLNKPALLGGAGLHVRLSVRVSVNKISEKVYNQSTSF